MVGEKSGNLTESGGQWKKIVGDFGVETVRDATKAWAPPSFWVGQEGGEQCFACPNPRNAPLPPFVSSLREKTCSDHVATDTGPRWMVSAIQKARSRRLREVCGSALEMPLILENANEVRK
jgi:hypothetical protein